MQTLTIAHERKLCKIAARKQKMQDDFITLEWLLENFLTDEMCKDFFPNGVKIKRLNEEHEFLHDLEVYADGEYVYKHVLVQVRFRIVSRNMMKDLQPNVYLNLYVKVNARPDAIWQHFSVSTQSVNLKLDDAPLLRNEKIGSIILAGQTEIDRQIDSAQKMVTSIGTGYEWRYAENSRNRAESLHTNIYLTPEEREEAYKSGIAHYEKLRTENEERELKRKLYELREQRAKKAYDLAYAEWRTRTEEAFKKFVKDRFKPWSFRKISLIPRNVNIHIEYDGDDHEGQLEDCIAEALIQVYSVLEGPDENGIYKILRGTEVKEVSLEGEIFEVEYIRIEDPYKHNNNAKAFHHGVNGIYTSAAYFSPADCPEKGDFVYDPTPVYKDFFDNTPIPVSLED